MRPRVTCAIHTRACVVTFGSREVLIHAGIMHAGRLWHLSLLPCSQAHLFGNGFTYIFFQMTLPLPLPGLTAPAHTHTDRAEATNMQQRAFRWCNAPSVGHVGGIWWLWTAYYASTFLNFAHLVIFSNFGFICFVFIWLNLFFQLNNHLIYAPATTDLHILISHDEACLHWLPVDLTALPSAYICKLLCPKFNSDSETKLCS